MRIGLLQLEVVVTDVVVCGRCRYRHLTAAVAVLVDEGDVEVRVQEDGRGHEEGQNADQGQDQQGLQLPYGVVGS